MKLTKKVEIIENPYDCNIRSIITTWYGRNSHGEFVWHEKSLTAYPENRTLVFIWYKDSMIKRTELIHY